MIKKDIIKRLALAVLTVFAFNCLAEAQDTSTSSLTRRTGTQSSRKKTNETDGPQVTDRMQSFFEDYGNNITDADKQWMRVIYRELDLDKDKNAPLYFPEDIMDNQENLFRIIMRLLANDQLTAYEYLDGREIFDESKQIKVGEMLERFDILHNEAKGSSAKSPKYDIHPSDVPTNEVLTYYIIEQWEFDTRSNKTKSNIIAICPVLHRASDFGGEPIRYPMFWVRYKDIRPWLAQQHIFTNDDNNLPTATYDDFFMQRMYDGDIYKTRNLKNRSMAQMFPDPDQRKAAQDSIHTRLTSFDKRLWVPDREEVIASSKSKSKKSSKEAVDNDDVEVIEGEAIEVVEGDGDDSQQEAAPKRSTKRAAAKKTAQKKTKVKETKPKTTSSSATRSVRRTK